MVKASLDHADDPRLALQVELGRLVAGSDGHSAEERTLAQVPLMVSSFCPTRQPPVADPRFPHAWACKGHDDEILPLAVAGAVEHSDYTIVILIGHAPPTPAVYEQLADSTTQLAHDVVQQLSQSR
jgi:hypothetical protein